MINMFTGEALFKNNVKSPRRMKFLFLIVICLLIFASTSASIFSTIGAEDELNEDTNTSRSASRENTAPKVNITHPLGGAKVSGIIEVNGTASDDVAVKWVNVVINSVHYNATDTSGNGTWWTWNYSLNTSKYSNGGLKITAYAHDGELAADTHVEILINNSQPENEKPVIWIEVPGNNTEVKGTITIKGHAIDDQKVRLVDMVIDSKEYQAIDTSGNNSWWSWKLVFDTTKLDNGEYWVTAWAWDAENKGGSDKILIIVNNNENHWPYVNFTHPKNEATVAGVITIKGYAWDIDGNVTSVQVRINGTYYNATDTSGNGTWYTWSLKFNTTILNDGEHRVVALAKDDGGKLGDEGIWIIVKNTKENKEPHVMITQPKNEATVKGVITIKGRAWDTDGSIKIVHIRIAEKYYKATDTSGNSTWYTWSVKYNTSILKDNEYRLTALAKDNAGKLTDAHIWIIVKNTVENEEPHVEIFQPKNEATVKGVITIKGHAWDVDGKVVSVQVKIGDTYYNATDDSGNNSWYNWSLKFNTSILKDGEHKIIAIAKDNLSKLGDGHSWIIVKNTVEKENLAPYIRITQPSNKATVSGAIKIKGKAWDADGKVKKVKIKINEVNYDAKDISGNDSWYQWSLEFDTTKLKNDEYRISASVFDGYIWEDAHIVVYIKNKLPTVQILTPTLGQNVSGLVNISGKALSVRSIKQVQIKIGDKKFNATDSSGNGTWYTWYFIWNTSGYENGSYKITAIIDDGVDIEDSHVEVKVKNIQTPKEKPKRKKRRQLPGFEIPLALIAGIVVVVCFFRSRGGRNRN